MTPEQQPSDRGARGGGLVLVGYRGTGKSTVGKILADLLHRPFLDADLEIEHRAGMPIATIFATQGEPAFRDWEEQTLRALALDHPGAVLATGGGAVLRAANRQLLRGFGYVVWLHADPAELVRRLQADPRLENRPALTSAGTLGEIGSVLEARRPYYQMVCDLSIETLGKEPEAIAAEVIGQAGTIFAFPI